MDDNRPQVSDAAGLVERAPRSLLRHNSLRTPTAPDRESQDEVERVLFCCFVVLLAALITLCFEISPASASAWESIQPQARVWLRQLDPQYENRRSDAERPWVTAQVREVDVPNGSVTFHHGPIPTGNDDDPSIS